VNKTHECGVEPERPLDGLKLPGGGRSAPSGGVGTLGNGSGHQFSGGGDREPTRGPDSGIELP
jgi:hypothetical protein